ncbi:MAG: LysR family transcriptional regulator [Pseudomonadota bacterium]
MQIDPRHLQMLWTIVDTGSLSRAARQLGKSQPSLSRTLSELETRLGTELFEKGRRPLRPTELGQTLAQTGRAIAQASEAATRAVTTHKSGQSGTLRMGGTPVFMDGVISPMVASFQSSFPDIRVDQSYGYLTGLTRQVEQGQIDLAICPVNRAAVPPGLNFQPLLPGRNVIASRAGHPLARKAALKLDDIAPFPWIAPPPDSPLFRDLRQVLAEIGITDMRVSFSGGSLTSMINVMVGSDALAILPHSVLYMRRHTKELTALPIRISHPERDLGMLSLAEGRSPVTDRLARFLTNQFGTLEHSIRAFERRSVWRA